MDNVHIDFFQSHQRACGSCACCSQATDENDYNERHEAFRDERATAFDIGTMMVCCDAFCVLSLPFVSGTMIFSHDSLCSVSPASYVADASM